MLHTAARSILRHTHATEESSAVRGLHEQGKRLSREETTRGFMKKLTNVHQLW